MATIVSLESTIAKLTAKVEGKSADILAVKSEIKQLKLDIRTAEKANKGTAKLEEKLGGKIGKLEKLTADLASAKADLKAKKSELKAALKATLKAAK